MSYESLDLKKPQESIDYEECSNFVIHSIKSIMKEAMDNGNDRFTLW